jgi:hypothetical protein
MRCVASVLVLITVWVAGVSAQDIDTKALKIIEEWVDGFCGKVPMQGNSSSLDLSGQGKVEISPLLKKLSDVGLQGTAKYHSSQYEGFLQKDLLEATRDRTKCKFKALDFLSTNFLTPAARMYVLPPTVRRELAAFVTEGTGLSREWQTRIAQQKGADAQKQIAAAIVNWHGRVKQRLALPPMDATYVARFENQIPSSTMPFGMQMDLGGVWAILQSDLQRLDQFMNER